MRKVIKVENLSKQYRLGDVGTGSLRDDFKRFRYRLMGKEDPFLQVGEVNNRTKKSDSDYVWALKDINFEIEQGDVVGIVGRNGAGKSTLLKILSRTTAPSIGSVKVKGRIASLLEVGTGFHGELSGRENIYLNGAIMGLRKWEIDKKLDEIIDFSGVEKYLDTPVKRYSSGMYVRLAFAVAAHLDPDILIVDEVLAVGDAEFQSKCIGKIRDVNGMSGRTVVFVSHNIAVLKQLCLSGILISNGNLIEFSTISDVLNKYIISNTKGVSSWKRDSVSKSKIFFEYLTIKTLKHGETYSIEAGEKFEIHIGIQVQKFEENATIAIRFTNSEGVPVFTTSYHDKQEKPLKEGLSTVICKIENNILIPGQYSLIVACFTSGHIEYDSVNTLQIKIEDLGVMKKDPDRLGIVNPLYLWE